MAQALVDQTPFLVEENSKDLTHAKDNGIDDVMIDRLRLTPQRIIDIAEGIKQVVTLADPVGKVIDGFTNLDGLKIPSNTCATRRRRYDF